MAIASIAVFEGPCPSHEEVLDFLRGRLPLVPRFRQKLRPVPLRLGRPVWVDDRHFDLCYHVRRIALPEPGEDQQLAALTALVMSRRLDRDHPLWEMWVAEGLAQGRWALIFKVHHCMVDGVSVVGWYDVIFGPSPGPSASVDDWAAGPEPAALQLAAEAALDAVLLPIREAVVLRAAVASPGRAVRRLAGTVRAFAALAPALRPAAASSLSGRIGHHRRYLWVRASLDDVREIQRKLGGTVNDVVLAAISGGFRSLLIARGELPRPHMVGSLIPVSVRKPGQENMRGNRVSAVLADLPAHVADPVERLTAVQAALRLLKTAGQAKAGEALVAVGRWAPYPFLSWSARLVLGLPQRAIVTVTTNVPGPRQPLYAMGRPLLEILPLVPIVSTVRTGVSIVTYRDNITFGITGDWAVGGDLDVLAHGIGNGISELLDAARNVRLHPPDG